MTTEPTIVERQPQPYMGIVNRVSMDSIPEAADRLAEVFGWIGARGIEMADAPFFKYNVIDMDRELEIEVGVPIAELLAWAEREGLRFAKEDTPSGELWECRLEVYSTDPAVEPDMNKWETTLLFKLA